MNEETNGPKVYQAINAVQRALAKTGIAKDRTNTQPGGGYKFRGIDDVYKAISPLMAEHGLCILPRMMTRVCEERQSKSGGALFYVTVEAEFDFVSSEDGTMHTARTFGEAMDSGDKATNKAMSAAYKYAAFQTFAIPTEGDNDADSATHVVETKEAVEWRLRTVTMDVAVERAIVLFGNDDKLGAYDEVSGCLTDLESQMYVWDKLGKEHSALRAYIKQMRKQEREIERLTPEAA